MAKKVKVVKVKGPVQKQRANVYTMMLIVSFIALSLGSFLLYKELERYEFEYEAPKRPKPPGVAMMITPTGSQYCLAIGNTV
ncbi:MAG: hypothetical protein K8T25_05620 [Planctomycetia bacterium]|nr:hypothetical protein [Planctomycetia bacterium]